MKQTLHDIKPLFLVVVFLLSFNFGWGQYAGSGTFTKISSLSELVDGYYVISYGTSQAMSNVNGGSYFGNSIISVSGNNIINPSTAIVWKIETNGSGRTIYNEASSKYVSYSGSDNYAFAVPSVLTDNQRWTFDYSSSLFTIKNVAISTRFLQYNLSYPRFACYNDATQENITLYKLSFTGPTISTTGTLSSLNTTYGTASSTTSFNVSGANMEAGISINPPTGFEVSTTADFSSNVGSNGAPITVGSAGTIASTTIYVRLSATANAGTYSGNIVLSSTNATSKNVATASSTINKATPTILATPTATAIFYEQSLSNSSLSGGSASVPGSFSFTNPTFVPTAVGVYPASVTFTPTNTTNYNIVTTTVNVTVNPPVNPTIYVNGSSLNFSSLCINASSASQTYSVSALSLTDNLIISAPTHFQIKTGAGAWGTSISLTPSSGSISSTTIEVRFAPTATGVFTSNITHSTTGGVTKNVLVSGEGIDTPPAIGNPSSTSGATTATLGGNITALGCSTTITTRGIEYSTTNGFANGAGTIVSESGTFTTGTFTINVSSLTPNTTYYFKAFATSASGVNYTTESSFTTLKAEPSNHPTNFRATEVATDKIVPVWTRSVAGTQMPDGYLIKANNNTVIDPEDGVEPELDNSMTDGANKNALPGSSETTPSFIHMSSGTMYYYKIYPYTNSGSNIDYKITGAPSFYHATLPTTPSLFSASGLIANAASISWSQGAYNAGVETLVFVKAGSAITNGTPNSNPATYTGNAVFGSGTPYFNDAAAYCVYKGDAASINVSGLTGNTTYHVTVLKVVENANSDGTYSYSTALTGSFTTPTIAAPVATAATSLGSSSFVANWNAVPGATGYVIDVSTTPFEELDIVGWNFPNDPDNNVADTGITENELKVLTTVGGTFNTAYIDVSSPLSDTSVALATGWNGGSDIKYWQVEFSTLGYNQLKLSSVQRSSNTGPKNFKAQYKVGTSGTWTDIPGATSITLANDWTTGVLTNVLLPVECNNQSSLYIRWIMTTNDAVTGGNVESTGTSSIDNIYIRADFSPNYVQLYQDYPVGNVTSFEVTGLDPNTTYYYIVRAIDATTETPNSNQIQVKTYQDINIADFRSLANGNYNVANTWEFDSGIPEVGWLSATQPPGADNNVLIQTSHTVTMTANASFNSGKTLTVNGTLATATHSITGAGSITVPSGGVVASGNLSDTDAFAGSLAVTGTIDFQTGSTFELNGAAKQYLGARTFSNLKISNTTGVKALGNLTVDGELSLAANPNDTDGSLDMVINYGSYATNKYGDNTNGDFRNSTLPFNNLNSYVLTMGATATTVGVGDVTGKIRRGPIADNTTYTFGNANTQLRFTSVAGSALPTQITVVATRGNHGTHIDNTGGVLINGYTANRNTLKRLYQILHVGGATATRFTLRMAYQDAELNGNTNESNLVTWDHHIPYGGRTPHEHGKTSFDPTGNWVELSNHSVSYLATEGDIAFTKYWMLSTKETISDYVWTGAVSSSWNILSNWSGGKVPNDTADVLIPDAAITNNDTVITTDSGYGILYPLPTFIPGEVRMRSLEIATGGLLTVEDGQAAKITIYGGPNAAGGGINYGSWDNKGTFNPGKSKVIFDYDATASESTISGTTQFYDVEIATGKKATVQSDTQISISNTLVNNGTFNAALLPNTITYNGTTAQTVLPTTYYNLTIANGVSATLGGNATTLNTLTLSDKFLTTGSYKMTMGISGVVSRTTGFVKGTLEKPLASTPSLFEIGTTVYAPVTVASTGLSGSVLVAAKATTGTPSQGSVLNASAKSDTYWTLTKSGAGSITNYTASFDIANTTNTGTLSRYRIAHYPASSWNILPTPTIAGTLYTTPTRTAFGDFELGEVKKTTWTGTEWTPVLPDIYTDAEIAGPYTSTAANAGSFSANSLTVNSGQSLTVSSGYSVTVANELVNNSTASSVTVENNANLIQLNDGINTGAITAKRNSAPMIRLDYTFWSSPVLGQNVYAFSPLTLVNRIYLFSTPINYYTTNGLSSLTTFAPGVAYVIRAPNNYSSSTPTEYNGIFTGVPNNGNYTFTLNTSSLGYNGVGNPYPSTIDATSFVNDNSSVIDGTLYFFAHTGTGEEAGQFALWNLSGGTAAASAQNSPGTTVAPNGTIQVGQGFIVKSLSTGGSLVFKNTQRIHDTRNQFYRSNSIPSVSNASVIERHRMWLNLSKIESSGAARMMNQMMVAYVSGATNDVDRGFDGLSYTSSGTLLASRLNAKNYSIQGRALPFTSTDVVPLVFKTTTVGTFEINLSNVDGLFTSASQPVYLYDKTLGRYHNLKTTPYRFTSEEGTFDLRFELVYPNMTLGINDSGLTTSVVYVSNDVLHIESLTEAIEEVRIFDLAGRLLLDKYQLNTLAFSADKLPFRDVVLLVQFKTVSGAVITRKVKF